MKVVVFSDFRDVLGVVQQVLADVRGLGGVATARRHAGGSSSASVPPPGHAVLLARIEAGGVGLNVQAASVVVVCEPQIKPTDDHRAVAGSPHGAGSGRRPLAMGGVDERTVRKPENKSRLCDAYARRVGCAG
ncbi:P-loop NTPase family protein [Streptomyces goshikiensis]|uniref:hypothetical protein n=1 Tax=Streptomyces goshikiensis TaxID=1942 RepID=UPI00371517CE